MKQSKQWFVDHIGKEIKASAADMSDFTPFIENESQAVALFAQQDNGMIFSELDAVPENIILPFTTSPYYL